MGVFFTLFLFSLCFSGCGGPLDAQALRYWYRMDSIPQASAVRNESSMPVSSPPVVPSPIAEPKDVATESSGGVVDSLNSCISSHPNEVCLGLEFVQFQQGISSSASSPSSNEWKEIINSINEIWKECRIAFQLEKVRVVKAQRYGLREHLSQYRDLERVRRIFSSPHRFLVAITPDWDRSGEMGESFANAWTNLPEETGGVYGVVLENRVSRDFRLIAHELGHYLGLGHEESSVRLMSL